MRLPSQSKPDGFASLGCGSQRSFRCRSCPAGRCPNNSSLNPPLAAVVVVAPKGGANPSAGSAAAEGRAATASPFGRGGSAIALTERAHPPKFQKNSEKSERFSGKVYLRIWNVKKSANRRDRAGAAAAVNSLQCRRLSREQTVYRVNFCRILGGKNNFSLLKKPPALAIMAIEDFSGKNSLLRKPISNQRWRSALQFAKI